MRSAALTSQFLSSLIATLVATTAFGQAASTPAPSPSPTATPISQNRPVHPNHMNPQDLEPSVANKRQVISKLKTVQAKQTQLITQIDEKLKSKLKDTQNFKMNEDGVTAEMRMSQLQESMEELDKKRREAIERSQFIDRLVFAVDTKWTKDSLKSFLERALLDMASAEMNQTDSKSTSLWKFATYLSVAVRELPEPREDLIAFIDNYMEFSTMLSPKPPTAFSQARSYTNGVKSEPAKTADQENLGDGVERIVGDRDQKSNDSSAVIQGTTTAPLEPALPQTQSPNAPNPEPTASQNSQ